jgi:hypothetical protein
MQDLLEAWRRLHFLRRSPYDVQLGSNLFNIELKLAPIQHALDPLGKPRNSRKL